MNLRLSLLVVVSALGIVVSGDGMPVRADSPTCRTTERDDYSVTLCISGPADESVVTGNVQITLTRSTTGSPPKIDRVVASLDGEYLLSDYVPHYSFSLPTTHFVDGEYTLRVYELYVNDAESHETAIDLTFANGITTPPVNPEIFVPRTVSGPAPLVAAIGDSASGERPQVTDMVRRWNPQMVLYLGDVYGRGTYTEFHNWYEPHLGQLHSITNPVVGNHEYDADGHATDYFFYWDNVPHFFSYDVGQWHIVMLDSNDEFDQLEPGTAQYDWLVQDLSASAHACTLVALHHPPLDVGRDGVNTSVGEHFWPLFANYNVDVVMTGHAHQYQRWHPVDAEGNLAQNAPVQIVNGTGGHHVNSFDDTDDRIAVGYDEEPEAFGAMRLKLLPDRMKFKFKNDAGVVLDSGVIRCHSAPPPTAPVLVTPLDDGPVTDSSPIFVWSENPASENVIRYKLVVKNGAGKKVFVRKVPAELCDGACSFDMGSTESSLKNKTYTWHIQAKNTGGKTRSEKWTLRVEAAVER